MTQKCDLICFSNVGALSHRLCCCFLSFSLSVFPQRLQESSSPLNTKSVPSCPTEFSHRLFMNYCARACVLLRWANDFSSRLPPHPPLRLSCGRLCFCLVHVFNTSTVSRVLGVLTAFLSNAPHQQVFDVEYFISFLETSQPAHLC